MRVEMFCGYKEGHSQKYKSYYMDLEFRPVPGDYFCPEDFENDELTGYEFEVKYVKIGKDEKGHHLVAHCETT